MLEERYDGRIYPFETVNSKANPRKVIALERLAASIAEGRVKVLDDKLLIAQMLGMERKQTATTYTYAAKVDEVGDDIPMALAICLSACEGNDMLYRREVRYESPFEEHISERYSLL